MIRKGKKIAVVCFTFMLLFSAMCAFTACQKEEEIETYTVTLWTEINPYRWQDNKTGGYFLKYPRAYKTIEVEEGDVLGNVELPEGADEHFLGWYYDQNYTMQFNQFVDPIKTDIRLYAKWDVAR